MYTKVKMWDTFCKYQLHTSCRIFVLYTKCIHDFCVGIRLPVSKQYLLLFQKTQSSNCCCAY